MPIDYQQLLEREIEIQLARFEDWIKSLVEAPQPQRTDTMQRQTRAAYEQVTQAQPDAFPAAHDAFVGQHGQSEWDRQQQLGVRREIRRQTEGG